jgi:hypothetical protein
VSLRSASAIFVTILPRTGSTDYRASRGPNTSKFGLRVSFSKNVGCPLEVLRDRVEPAASPAMSAVPPILFPKAHFSAWRFIWLGLGLMFVALLQRRCGRDRPRYHRLRRRCQADRPRPCLNVHCVSVTVPVPGWCLCSACIADCHSSAPRPSAALLM